MSSGIVWSKPSRSQLPLLVLPQRIRIKQLAREKQIQIDLNIENGPYRISGDRERFKQVFINLVKNAVEAMKQNGTLTISAQHSGEKIQVDISDDGPGIQRNLKSKIFKPFFTTKKGGTGLGLSICQRIIDEHQGCTLDLTATHGKGTCARVCFPAA